MEGHCLRIVPRRGYGARTRSRGADRKQVSAFQAMLSTVLTSEIMMSSKNLYMDTTIFKRR